MPTLPSLDRWRMTAVVALVALLTAPGFAQESLSTRLLLAEDARVLSLETHALLTGGLTRRFARRPCGRRDVSRRRRC
jgi:hypothetical protein